MRQSEIDRRNSEFWNELCGSTLARSLGITDHSPESLRQFDDAYLALYPYLLSIVRPDRLAAKDVLRSVSATGRSVSKSCSPVLDTWDSTLRPTRCA